MALRGGTAEPEQSDETTTIKGVSSGGVVLVTPEDAEFKSELVRLTRGKDRRVKILIGAGMPFCVFVRNTSERDIVGCSVEWKIVKPDGITTITGQSFSSPGVLTGLRPADPAMVGHTSLVNAKATGFFSLDADLKQLIDNLTKSIQAKPALNLEDEEFTRLINHWRSQRNELVQPGSTITVSIDGLIFSDGAFFGPDNNRLIISTKALIKAKRDLGKIIEQQAKVYTNSDALLEKVLAIAEQHSVASPKEMSAPDDAQLHHLYLKYWKISIDELISIRTAHGSKEAIKYSQEAFHREWPSLHPSETSRPPG